MKRPSPLRLALLVLAFAHTFPLAKHGGLLLADPSVGEAWKSFGALISIVICCTPVAWYARGLSFVSKRRPALLLASALLVTAHLVPAADHLPRFVVHPSWGDGWRGIGAAIAIAWFLSPLEVQARVVRALRDGRAVKGRQLVSRLSIVAMISVVFLAGVIFGVRHLARTEAAERSADRPPLAKPAQLHVPRASGTMVIDGELDEKSWDDAGRTRGFVRGDGTQARPYSEARLTWGDGKLFVALYAADEDIRRDDAFQLFFDGPSGEHGLDVRADGKTTTRLTRWQSPPTLAQDADGTMDDPSDDDEEWLIEMAIPLAELGLKGAPGERLTFAARRCDTPKGGHRTCGSWGGDVAGVLILD